MHVLAVLGCLLAIMPGVPARARESVVLLSAPLAGGKAAFGAGVILRSGRNLSVVTAGHIGTLAHLTIVTSRGERLEAETVKVDAVRDIALIRTSPSREHYAVPAIAPAFDAQRVFLWGFSLNTDPTFARATIVSTRASFPDGKPQTRIAIDCADCAAGDSGSGIFSETGELLGIMTAVWKTPGGVFRLVEAQAATASLQTFE